MLKKYSVLFCVIFSALLLAIAAMVYPGGSILDKNSVGFNWSQNFISNLFTAKAINGADSSSRMWAIPAMALHSVGYGIFFLHMRKKMPVKHARLVLKVVGIANIFFSFLIVTSLHDVMITISSTLFLLGLFYITVFVFRTRLHWLKILCVVGLLIFYYTLFLYGYGNWQLLAVMQKVAMVASILLVLALEYFTVKQDFTDKQGAYKMQDPAIDSDLHRHL